MVESAPAAIYNDLRSVSVCVWVCVSGRFTGLVSQPQYLQQVFPQRKPGPSGLQERSAGVESPASKQWQKHQNIVIKKKKNWLKCAECSCCPECGRPPLSTDSPLEFPNVIFLCGCSSFTHLRKKKNSSGDPPGCWPRAKCSPTDPAELKSKSGVNPRSVRLTDMKMSPLWTRRGGARLVV